MASCDPTSGAGSLKTDRSVSDPGAPGAPSGTTDSRYSNPHSPSPPAPEQLGHPSSPTITISSADSPFATDPGTAAALDALQAKLDSGAIDRAEFEQIQSVMLRAKAEEDSDAGRAGTPPSPTEPDSLTAAGASEPDDAADDSELAAAAATASTGEDARKAFMQMMEQRGVRERAALTRSQSAKSARHTPSGSPTGITRRRHGSGSMYTVAATEKKQATGASAAEARTVSPALTIGWAGPPPKRPGSGGSGRRKRHPAIIRDTKSADPGAAGTPPPGRSSSGRSDDGVFSPARVLSSPTIPARVTPLGAPAPVAVVAGPAAHPASPGAQPVSMPLPRGPSGLAGVVSPLAGSAPAAGVGVAASASAAAAAAKKRRGHRRQVSLGSLDELKAAMEGAADGPASPAASSKHKSRLVRSGSTGGLAATIGSGLIDPRSLCAREPE